MQSEDTRSVVRSLGIVATVAASLVLGAALPALAEDEGIGSNENSKACSVVEAESTGEREWTVPPMPGRPGEPY